MITSPAKISGMTRHDTKATGVATARAGSFHQGLRVSAREQKQRHGADKPRRKRLRRGKEPHLRVRRAKYVRGKAVGDGPCPAHFRLCVCRGVARAFLEDLRRSAWQAEPQRASRSCRERRKPPFGHPCSKPRCRGCSRAARRRASARERADRQPASAINRRRSNATIRESERVPEKCSSSRAASPPEIQTLSPAGDTEAEAGGSLPPFARRAT